MRWHNLGEIKNKQTNKHIKSMSGGKKKKQPPTGLHGLQLLP